MPGRFTQGFPNGLRGPERSSSGGTGVDADAPELIASSRRMGLGLERGGRFGLLLVHFAKGC